MDGSHITPKFQGLQVQACSSTLMKEVNILSPRARSKDKVVPISIGIPSSLMSRLERHLDYTQSRSKWVADAIEIKFKQTAAIDLFTIHELLDQLYHLNLFSLGELSKYHTRARSLIAEIEEAR